jgi:hypothetical protein
VGDAEGVAAVGPAVRVREPELELVKLTEPVGLALWVPEVEVEPVGLALWVPGVEVEPVGLALWVPEVEVEPVGLALWVPEVEVLPVTDVLVVPDKLPLTLTLALAVPVPLALGDAVGDGDAEEQTAAPASLLVPTGHWAAVGDVDPGGQKNLSRTAAPFVCDCRNIAATMPTPLMQRAAPVHSPSATCTSAKACGLPRRPPPPRVARTVTRCAVGASSPVPARWASTRAGGRVKTHQVAESTWQTAGARNGC